ncbi:hypothetical protein B0I37DRAFT_364135 [Chaetomium sp. MPI-CAGE-AT-0009]|nr:hypothetical protein B0I37DRAFT_364135 [Chaetomium sp. MPI-CAGE-AT-0009]
MPMDSYHPFQIRTPEGGGVHDGDGHDTAADATEERSPISFSFTFVAVLIVVLYFMAMFFLGLLCYTDRALRRPSYERQDGCCSVLWKAIKFAFFIRFLEICWESCCSSRRGSGRPVAVADSGSSRRAREDPADHEWYGGSPYPSPYYNRWYAPPGEEAQPIPLQSMREPAPRNTSGDSSENGNRSVPARTWSGSTLGRSDGALPERPPRARLPRAMSEASTLRDA